MPTWHCRSTRRSRPTCFRTARSRTPTRRRATLSSRATFRRIPPRADNQTEMNDRGAVRKPPPLSHSDGQSVDRDGQGNSDGHAPKLAEGIELMGEYKDSGFKQ